MRDRQCGGCNHSAIAGRRGFRRERNRYGMVDQDPRRRMHRRFGKMQRANNARFLSLEFGIILFDPFIPLRCPGSVCWKPEVLFGKRVNVPFKDTLVWHAVLDGRPIADNLQIVDDVLYFDRRRFRKASFDATFCL